MATIRLADVFDITQVSSDNMKVWPTLTKIMSSYNRDEKITIDTEGINIECPWMNAEFSKMLSRGNIHMITYHSEEVCNGIKILLNALVGKGNSVENKGTTVEERSVEEKENKITVQRLKQAAFIVGDCGVIEIGKAFSTVSFPYIIEDLMYVIDGMIPPRDYAKNITLDFEGVGAISNSVFEALHKGLKKLVVQGIKLNIQNIDSNDSDQLEIIAVLESGMRRDLKGGEKAKILKRRLQVNTVGMLCKYEHSRKLDTCGRKGGGRILWSRISIFKGLSRDQSGIISAKFLTYHKDRFCTQLHKMMEFMETSEEASVLESDKEIIPIENLGFWDSFFGSDYHFNFLVQYDKSQSKKIWLYNSDGNSVFPELTLPELAKAVLEDYGIPYNKSNIEEYIRETKKELGQM